MSSSSSKSKATVSSPGSSSSTSTATSTSSKMRKRACSPKQPSSKRAHSPEQSSKKARPSETYSKKAQLKIRSSSKSTPPEISSASRKNKNKDEIQTVPSSIKASSSSSTKGHSKPRQKLEPKTKTKLGHNRYDHLSEEERSIVVGLRLRSASHSPNKPSGKVVLKSKDYLPSVKTSERSSKTVTATTAQTKSPSVQFLGTTSGTHFTATTTSSSRLSLQMNESDCILLDSTVSTPASSTSVQTRSHVTKRTPQQTQLDSSVLMQVSKNGQLVFVDPFLSTSPAPVINQSHSVVVIEDSPLQDKSLFFHSTSTPRPSCVNPPSFNLFPSPIVTNVQTPSSIHGDLCNTIDFSFSNSKDQTVKSSADDDTMEDMDITTTIIEEVDMEVDEETALLCAREKTVNMSTEVIGHLTDTVAKMSSFIEDSLTKTIIESSEEKSFVVLVIDTNVFISAKSFVVEAIQLAEDYDILVLLPWVVLQELDYLKQNNRNLKSRCMITVRFINKYLLEDSPYLIFQTPQQSTETLIPIENNDDKILVCCLQRKQNYKKDRVILVTRDINLSSKAKVSGIESSSDVNLWNQVIDTSKKVTLTSSCLRLGEAKNKADNQPTQKEQNVPCDVNVQNKVNNNVPLTNNAKNPSKPVQEQLDNRPPKTMVMLHPPTEGSSRLNDKVSFIWNLIETIRSKILQDLNAGPNYPCFGQAKAAAAVMEETIRLLGEQFHRCLILSPVHISDFPHLFVGLRYRLDNFCADCKVSGSNTGGQLLTNNDVINHFKRTFNRPDLFSRYQELEDFHKSFKAIISS